MLLFVLSSRAVAASCQVSISDNGRYLVNSTVNIDLVVTNTGDANITWIKVPTNFGQSLSSMGITVDGWSTDAQSDADVFLGWFLPPGSSVTFHVTGQAGDSESSTNWEVLTSQSDENGAESCNSVNMAIVNSLEQPTSVPTQPAPTPLPLPAISGVVVNVGSTVATISWQTDMDASGVVNYGLADSYGISANDSGSGKNHSVTISNLVPSTTYHYQIQSSNDNGTTTITDNSFSTTEPGAVITKVVTATVIVTTTVTNTVTNTVNNTILVTPTPTPKLVDTVSPIVTVTTDFGKPFKVSPAIDGKASDGGVINAGVAKLEYSIDNGKNWAPVETIDHPGGLSTTFEFTPPPLDDGNYLVKVRAEDLTGNKGVSKVQMMVIDRLPPEVGGSLFSVGPMILEPDENSNVEVLTGMDFKVVMSAVGGPLKVDLSVDSKQVHLIKNVESGLWAGTVNVSDVGKFKLSTDSVDGAKNETKRDSETMVVLPLGKVTDDSGRSVVGATVKVFSLEKTTMAFVPWDGQPYSQDNPQTTDQGGTYKLILPVGKYYLEIKNFGSRTLRTAIFEIDKPTIVNTNFSIGKQALWGDWWSEEVPFVTAQTQISLGSNSDLIGKMLPSFDLGTTEVPFLETSILGKPTVLTFFSTWQPNTADQLATLDQLQAENQEINVVAVDVQESVSKTDVFKKIGGYKMEMVADPDGILVVPLNILSLPTHIFMDRKGIINSVKTGFLNKDDLLKEILN